MYEEYFKLSGAPFKINPDPKFFFGSRSHNKAMSYLHYGLRQAEGFIVITGEIGAGKSILIGHLIDQLDRSSVVAAHLLTPNLKPDALLSHILSAFRIEPANDGKTAEIEAFEDFLFDQLNRGRRVLLVVDEAQSLPKETLEELRILSNMDYDGTPLFQVFLLGQPDFRPVISAPDMEQLRQRIIASYHLKPLTLEETREYIEHRMTVVGWDNNPVFEDGAFQKIFDATSGVPRKINKLCNRILLFCSLEERRKVDRETVEAVLKDMETEDATGRVADKSGAAKATAETSIETVGETSTAKSSSQRKTVETMPAAKPFAAAADADRPAQEETVDRDVVVPFSAAARNGAEIADDADEKDVKDDVAAVIENAAEGEADDTAPAAQQVSSVEDEAGSGPVREKEGDMDDNARTAEAPSGETAKAASAGVAQESVLDRLRRRREAGAQSGKTAAPASATLHDVADAIAAVGSGAAANGSDAKGPDGEFGRLNTDEEAGVSLDAPEVDDDPKGWKTSVVRSINDTRDELKSAHTNVTRLRRTLTEIDRRRRQNREQIVASLDRADTLLGEIRDAWR